MRELFSEYALTLLTIISGVLIVGIVFSVFLEPESSFAQGISQYMEIFVRWVLWLENILEHYLYC